MVTVTKQFMFEASHKLPYYEGACHNLHGHSYKLEVTVIGDIIKDTNHAKRGMIIDFKDLKDIVKKVAVDKYDHSYLNVFFENPTAEIMVHKIAMDIMKELPKGVTLVSCKLWETTTSYAEYNNFNGMIANRLFEAERLLKYADNPTLKSAT